MSFPSTSAPSPVSVASGTGNRNSVSFDNDPQGSPPQAPDPLTLSDINYTSVLLSLDSFLPILRHLPGLYLDQNLYYIRGSIATADWARLRDQARMVSKFIVTDKDSEARISPAAFLRLALSQDPELPFFPSLSDLVIIDADESLSYLELLLTPSLKSLEVVCIPDAQQPTLLSFLITLVQKAPLLQSVNFGPGRFSSSSLQIIPQFPNLHHLELKSEDLEIPFALFDDIGSLSNLETLILDARYVTSIVSKNQPNGMDGSTLVPSAIENVNTFPSDSSSSMDGNQNEDGDSDVLLSQTCSTPTSISTSGTFSQLRKLHVIGWLPLLEDLIPRITSDKLEDVSVTFIRLSDDELKVSLAKEKQERRNEEKRKRDEEQQKEEMEPSFDSDTGKPGLSFCEPPRIPKKKQKKGNQDNEPNNERIVEKRRREEKERMLLVAMREAQVAKEAEEVQNISSDLYTTPFTNLLQMLCCRWTESLKTVSVGQLDRSCQSLVKPPILPEGMFLELLLLPAIENLEVKGWILDSVETLFGVVESIPNLKSLLLPLDGTNSGISLPALRCVAETCPKLESFQCRIKSLSLVPEYTVPTTETLFHCLRTLSVGNSSPHPDPKKLYLIARHLDLLFPHLEEIAVSKEHNAEQWVVVTELVKMCQTARMDERYRASLEPRM